MSEVKALIMIPFDFAFLRLTLLTSLRELKSTQLLGFLSWEEFTGLFPSRLGLVNQYS